MFVSEKMKIVLKAIEGISFDEWLKLQKAVNTTFEDQERQARKNLKLEDMNRVVQVIQYP